MALTGKQTLIGIVITFLVLLLIIELLPPTSPSILQYILGAGALAMGLINSVFSVLIKQGKLKPSLFWGRSAAEAFWLGIGLSALGLGHLWQWIVPAGSPMTPKYIGMAIFAIAVIVARRSVREEVTI